MEIVITPLETVYAIFSIVVQIVVVNFSTIGFKNIWIISNTFFQFLLAQVNLIPNPLEQLFVHFQSSEKFHSNLPQNFVNPKVLSYLMSQLLENKNMFMHWKEWLVIFEYLSKNAWYC